MFQWHYEFNNELTFAEAWNGNFVVWMFFVSETMILTLLVHDRKRHLRRNWLNLVIICIGLPLLLIDYGPMISVLGALRFFFVVGLLIPWVGLSIRFLTDNRLDTTIFAGIIILLLAAVMMVEIDPNINSIKDGIWWAWVTISTVGYGDIVPTSSFGRLFASVLILFGLGLFSVITANFAALFIQRNNRLKNKAFKDNWEENFHRLDELKAYEELLINRIDELTKKIETLETKSISLPIPGEKRKGSDPGM